MARYRIEVTPSAARRLRALPTGAAQDARQMIQGVAELASVYPRSSPLWSRLGRASGTTVELDLSGSVLELDFDPARKVIRVVSVTARRPAAAQSIRGSGRRALSTAAMAPALPRRRRARAELFS